MIISGKTLSLRDAVLHCKILNKTKNKPANTERFLKIPLWLTFGEIYILINKVSAEIFWEL